MVDPPPGLSLFGGAAGRAIADPLGADLARQAIVAVLVEIGHGRDLALKAVGFEAAVHGGHHWAAGIGAGAAHFHAHPAIADIAVLDLALVALLGEQFGGRL